MLPETRSAAARGARLLEAQARWQRCAALTKLGETGGAGAECIRASQLADVSGGNLVKARSLTALANLSRKQGKNSEAMEWHQQALQILRAVFFLTGQIVDGRGDRDDFLAAEHRVDPSAQP